MASRNFWISMKSVSPARQQRSVLLQQRPCLVFSLCRIRKLKGFSHTEEKFLAVILFKGLHSFQQAEQQLVLARLG